MIKEFYRGLTVCGASLLSFVLAAEFTVKTGDKTAPSQVAEPIRSALTSKPVQLLDGDKPLLQIWLLNEIPFKSKPSLNAIPEAALVALVSVEAAGLKDYKENDIPKGVFTARFVTQPQDGDHLGTAEFSTFLALIPVEADKTLDAFSKFTPTVKASGKLTSSGHPLIISLRPVSSADGKFPSLTEPAAEHKAIRLKIQGKAEDGQAGEVPFELVYEGHGHTQ
jgi:hypothetical protein